MSTALLSVILLSTVLMSVILLSIVLLNAILLTIGSSIGLKLPLLTTRVVIYDRHMLIVQATDVAHWLISQNYYVCFILIASRLPS